MKYPYPNYPTTKWTIHENMESDIQLIPAGSQFSLEPISVNGEIAFYRMTFTDNKIDSSLQGLNLYPVGIVDLPAPSDKLPPWGNSSTDGKSHDAALAIRQLARKNSTATRLEGAFVLPKGGTIPNETLIFRLYYFAGAETNGHDWIVVDFVASGTSQPRGAGLPHILEDGTAHGDN